MDGGGGDYTGSVGTGAGGVTIFAYKYGFPSFGQASSAIETPDRAFVLAGLRQPDSSAAQLYLVKTNAQGGVIWERNYTSPDNTSTALGWSVKRTSDGGYIVAGSCYYSSSWWYYLLKTDANGNVLWSKRYPGALFDAGFTSVVQTPDDGYVAVGSITGQMVDVYLVKTDSSGNIIWEKTYGDFGPDYGNALIATADGGFAIAGEYDGGGPTMTGLLQKTDALGNSAWLGTYSNAKFTGVVQAADNGFVLVGNTYDAGGKFDLLVVKTDAAGIETHRRTFGGAANDTGASIARTQDGGYIVTGATSSYSSDTNPVLMADIFLIKLNSNLDTVWQRVKGRSMSGDGGNAVVAVSDGGYLVGGALGGSPMLAKFDGSGNTVPLGDTDFTYTPPEGVQGIITMTNADQAAGAAVTSFDVARMIGPTTLDLLIGVLGGATPSSFCTGGGTYDNTLAPAGPVANGSVYSVTFNNCVVNPGPDSTTLNGSITMTFDSVTGSLAADPYAVDTRINLSAFSFADSVASKLLSGDLRFTRSTSTFGQQNDHALSLTGMTLSLTWPGVNMTIGPFSVESATTATAFALGPATATIDRSGIGTLQASIQTGQWVQGVSASAPTSGIVTTTATDNTSVKATVSAGSAVRLDVDSNGDGTYEGSRNTTWDALLY